MSGVIRFISDPHFGHKNMAIKRGFNDDYYHDTTWILGDITMEKNNYAILDRLLGNKRVILGNHDMGNHAKTLIHHVNSIHGMVNLRNKEYGDIFLTHCPVHPYELDYRVKFNIHGHLHENSVMIPCSNPELPKRLDKRYINVSAEMVNYVPKTLKELFEND
jgi:calcineurin-like phosphoesterase family protein